MTPTEMLSRMTSGEIAEQMAYDQLEGEDIARATGHPAAQEDMAVKLARVFPVSRG